jgi:hypothetical protein
MPVRRSDDTQYTLGTGLSATGNAVAVRGGFYTFTVEGTLTGATASLQLQAPSGTWSDVAIFSGSVVKTTTTPYAQSGIALPAGNVRVALAGGTPTAVAAYLVGEG